MSVHGKATLYFSEQGGRLRKVANEANTETDANNRFLQRAEARFGQTSAPPSATPSMPRP